MSSAYDYPPDAPLKLTPGAGLAAILKRALEIQSYVAAHFADDLIIDYSTRKTIAAASAANVAEMQAFIDAYRIDVTARKPKKLKLCKACAAIK
jgi:hypothetical protein